MLKKFLSVIIGVVIFITCIPSSVFAQDMEKSSLDKIPSIVQYSVSDKTRLVKRLSKFDNYMNTVGYLNSDGTETVYIFGDDIKYRNKNATFFYRMLHFYLHIIYRTMEAFLNP